MTTGAAATSRFVNVSTAAATQNSIMQIKNTRRPSRSRSRRAPTTRDRLSLGAGGDRLLKRTYKECMKAAMLEVAGALQLDQSPARGA